MVRVQHPFSEKIHERRGRGFQNSCLGNFRESGSFHPLSHNQWENPPKACFLGGIWLENPPKKPPNREACVRPSNSPSHKAGLWKMVAGENLAVGRIHPCVSANSATRKRCPLSDIQCQLTGLPCRRISAIISDCPTYMLSLCESFIEEQFRRVQTVAEDDVPFPAQSLQKCH